jgi:hypothetical protein
MLQNLTLPSCSFCKFVKCNFFKVAQGNNTKSSGVNLTNILHAAFLYKSFARSFFVLAVKVKLFIGARILVQMSLLIVGEIDFSPNAVRQQLFVWRKSLVKLTTGHRFLLGLFYLLRYVTRGGTLKSQNDDFPFSGC